jgi:tight adherence protein C
MPPLTFAILAGSVLAFFTGVVMLLATVVGASVGRAGVRRSLDAIDHIYSGGRVEAPPEPAPAPATVGNRMAKLGRAATSVRGLASLRRWLDYAGNPPYWTVDRLFEVKGLALIVAGIAGLLIGLLVGGPTGALLGGLCGAVLGFVSPDLVLRQVSANRQDAIRRTLPDIIDTLTISVEAGLGLEPGFGQITKYGRGPLAGEFARVLQEIQIGRSRVDALRELAKRTSVNELRSFCAIIVQASELGVPIAAVLREQSREMRVRRRQRAEELARKIPVKILFPLVFCLFPGIFIVVLGPGMINVLDAFAR